jgi:class 3 adenylate cyclase/sporulation protein YlmC with PRC-barrel domain
LTSGKYFNKGVKALDAADLGHVVRETTNKIIVFGKKGERYDIPIHEIQQVGANVLIGLSLSDIVDQYEVKRGDPMPQGRKEPWPSEVSTIDLAAYEGKYPTSLFNKGVRANNEDDLGHIMKETKNKIIVFGYSNTRYDIPKYHIIAVGRNVILDIDFPEIYEYQVDRNSPIPTSDDGEDISEDQKLDVHLNDIGKQAKEEEGNTTTRKEMLTEEFYTYYHGPREELEQTPPYTQRPGQLFDLQTLLNQRQDRLWEALEERYQYNTSIKRSQDFLAKHVCSKVPFVIMFVDLVGSTNMSMTLSAEKLVTIVTAFSREISSVIESYDGYVLKYVGDAVIGFIPSIFNKYLACDRSFECAESIINVIKNGINPILGKMDYPKLSVKIGIDEGENVVVQYGYDRSSPIDILGYGMNVAAKITSLAPANKIAVGEDVFKLLHPKMQSRFKLLSTSKRGWKYVNRHSGNKYKVYCLK